MSTAIASRVPADEAAAGPVRARDRVLEMDVLRGIALFGVFLVNMVGFCGAGLMATDQQLMALPTAALDGMLRNLMHWLVSGKANTLFAFLFGLGFYLQMQRAQARGADFDRIYLRRLTVLLVLGVVHTLFFWVWDILNLYALAGFVLYALRRASDRVLLLGGVLLATFSLTAHEALLEYAGLADWHGHASPNGDEAVLARQAAGLAGDYWGLVRVFWEFTLVDWLLTGAILGWLGHALGRFMIGAWVGRRGWLQDVVAHLPGFRRVLRWTLPTGLILGGIGHLVGEYGESGRLPAWAYWEILGAALHHVALPVLATGYLCAIVVGLHTTLGHRLLAPFAWPGRMALSNYVGQSLIYGFVLFGVGPGLSLAGGIGTSTVMAIVVVAYAAQVAFSRWWLARFRYGPLEWVWRGLTYGRWPAWRIDAASTGAVGTG